MIYLVVVSVFSTKEVGCQLEFLLGMSDIFGDNELGFHEYTS